MIMRIPGEEAAEFVLIQPLVPRRRPNMIAWVAARMDPGVYGERIAFHFPTDTTTEGPALIEARIDQDDAIAPQFSLWDRSGSSVIRGNLLVLPIGEDGLLYVEPIFLQAQGAPFPQFVRVIMVATGPGRLRRERARCHRAAAGRARATAARRRRARRALPEDVAGLVADRGAAAVRRGAGRAGRRRPGHLPGSLNELEPVLDRLAELTGASPGPHPAPRPSAWTSWSSAPGRASTPSPGAWPATRSPRGADRARQRRDSRRGGDVPTSTHSTRRRSRATRAERYDLVVIGPEGAAGGRRGRRAGRRIGPDLRADPRSAAAGVDQGLRQGAVWRAGVATAASATFTDPDAAVAHARRQDRPPVVKADWLAAGKGVVVPETMDEAEEAIRDLLAGAARRAGSCSRSGWRARGVGLCSGQWRGRRPAGGGLRLQAAGRRGRRTEHRRDGCLRAGAVVRRRDALEAAVAGVFEPIAWRMARDGIPYRGVLYAGLMLTDAGPDGARVQRALRRPGGAGPPAAARRRAGRRCSAWHRGDRGPMEGSLALAVRRGGGRGDRLGGVSRRARWAAAQRGGAGGSRR